VAAVGVRRRVRQDADKGLDGRSVEGAFDGEERVGIRVLVPFDAVPGK
jgi:hypothetical protein